MTRKSKEKYIQRNSCQETLRIPSHDSEYFIAHLWGRFIIFICAVVSLNSTHCPTRILRALRSTGAAKDLSQHC